MPNGLSLCHTRTKEPQCLTETLSDTNSYSQQCCRGGQQVAQPYSMVEQPAQGAISMASTQLLGL